MSWKIIHSCISSCGTADGGTRTASCPNTSYTFFVSNIARQISFYLSSSIKKNQKIISDCKQNQFQTIWFSEFNAKSMKLMDKFRYCEKNTQIWKKKSRNLFWHCYLTNFKIKWNIFSHFVDHWQYLNFIIYWNKDNCLKHLIWYKHSAIYPPSSFSKLYFLSGKEQHISCESILFFFAK